jgi:hypothetical protein
MTTSPPPQLANAARIVRILHTALLGGLFMSGAMLYLVRRLSPPPSLGDGPTLAMVLGAASLVLLGIAMSVLRPRVADPRPGQDSNTYWKDATSRGAAIVVWATIEEAGMVGAVGYFLTGSIAPRVAFALALGAQVILRPARIDGDGA